MRIEDQGHFFTIYFPGFVCIVLYLDKISGERLQDHWSSGYHIWQGSPSGHVTNIVLIYFHFLVPKSLHIKFGQKRSSSF